MAKKPATLQVRAGVKRGKAEISVVAAVQLGNLVDFETERVRRALADGIVDTIRKLPFGGYSITEIKVTR